MKNDIITDSYGTKLWYKEGKLYREDGPAVEWFDGDKGWYKEGMRHREDGPAIELTDGTKHWYYEGEEIKCSSNKEFLQIIKLKLFW